jgi:hypothetical protein
MATMMLTLTLAAGLLAAPEPQAEPQKGWVVELHGYTYHRQAKPEGWLIELQGFTRHRKQAETPKGWIIDWQFPQGKPQPEPVEAQYHDDLSAFFKQLKMQRHGEAVKAFYVDDLPAFFKQLKKR